MYIQKRNANWNMITVRKENPNTVHDTWSMFVATSVFTHHKLTYQTFYLYSKNGLSTHLRLQHSLHLYGQNLTELNADQHLLFLCPSISWWTLSLPPRQLLTDYFKMQPDYIGPQPEFPTFPLNGTCSWKFFYFFHFLLSLLVETEWLLWRPHFKILLSMLL